MFTQKEVTRFVKRNFRKLNLQPAAKILLYRIANEEAKLLLLAANNLLDSAQIDEQAVERAFRIVCGQV